MEEGPQYCTGSNEQNHPKEKEEQEITLHMDVIRWSVPISD